MSGNDKMRRGSSFSSSAKKVLGVLAGKTDDANLTTEQREKIQAEKRIMEAKEKAALAEKQAKKSETKVKTKEEKEAKARKEEEARIARLLKEKEREEAGKNAADYEAKLANEQLRNLQLEQAGLPFLKEFLKAQRCVNSAPSELEQMKVERDRLDNLIKYFPTELNKRKNNFLTAVAGVKNFLGRDDALTTYLTLMSEKKEEWQEAVRATKEPEERLRSGSRSGSSQKSLTSSYNKSADDSRRASSNESKNSSYDNKQSSNISGGRKPPARPNKGITRSDSDLL